MSPQWQTKALHEEHLENLWSAPHAGALNTSSETVYIHFTYIIHAHYMYLPLPCFGLSFFHPGFTAHSPVTK